MNATDELRDWIRSLYTPNGTELKSEGLAIADRIDEEHQKAIQELNSLCETSVLLPIDADGVPIRIGDFMEHMYKGSKSRPNHRFRVFSIHYHDYGEGCSLIEAGLPTIKYNPSECHHYNELTVEDVLREFANQFAPEATTLSYQDFEETIAEYAAKLRLAGDGEEQ